MRLTKAQVRFIGANLHAQDYWLARTGKILECNPTCGREKITMGALVRKGAIGQYGQFTKEARRRFKAIVDRQARKNP